MSGREGAVIMKHSGVSYGHHGEIVLLPMAGHHQDGLRGGADFFGHPGECGFQAGEHLAHVWQPRPRTATVGDEMSGKFGHLGLLWSWES